MGETKKADYPDQARSRTPPELALLIVSIAAPYLVSLFRGLWIATSRRPISGFGDFLEFMMATVVIGSIGVLLYGIPVAIAAGALAAICARIGLHHPLAAMFCGAALGVFFAIGLGLKAGPHDFLPDLGAVSLSGAICGWIYWRLAVRGGNSSSP